MSTYARVSPELLQESETGRVAGGHHYEADEQDADRLVSAEADVDERAVLPSAWAEYHQATAVSARFDGWPDNQTLLYVAAGLANEAGETAGQAKKAVRDDGGEITDERRQAVVDELGDVLWYAARVAESVGATLEDAATANVAKVRRRLANGTLSGSGDR